MAPIADGFQILVAGAAFLGVLVGSIGGAVVWRVRINLALGGFLTACAYLLVLVASHPGDFIWLRAKLTWGVPAMTVAFLIASVSARWLETRTTLRHTWTTLAAFGFSLSMGFLYLLLFRVSMRVPLLVAPTVDAFLILILLLMRSRTLVRQ